MDSTPKRIAANQSNASKSTGPKTADGKRRTSLNALKHGRLSKDLVISGEDEKDYKKLMDGLLDSHQPINTTEIILVEKMAIALWKMKRLHRIETARINASMVSNVSRPLYGVRNLDPDQFAMAVNVEQLMKYQSLLEGQYYRALNTLLNLQEARKSIIEAQVIKVGQE